MRIIANLIHGLTCSKCKKRYPELILIEDTRAETSDSYCMDCLKEKIDGLAKFMGKKYYS